MEKKDQTINEFSTQIKETGTGSRSINLYPSLIINEDILDILNFVREYKDRIIWNEKLYKWLEKHNFLNEFKEYYD